MVQITQLGEFSVLGKSDSSKGRLAGLSRPQAHQHRWETACLDLSSSFILKSQIALREGFCSATGGQGWR
jgi:hypothetical protein